jgi:uncharacterized Zn-binding protein involved in type VI secretion
VVYIPPTTTTSTTTSTSTTTTTTTPTYTCAGTIHNQTANTITAGTAIIKVNGSTVAIITMNIAPGATQVFSTSYCVPVSGSGNNFILELYSYTGITTTNDMQQLAGDSSTSIGAFVNMGSYLRATSTMTSGGSQYVIGMKIYT